MIKSLYFHITLGITLSILSAGCLKDLESEISKPVRLWACSEEADAALKNRDYDAGIRLHQRILTAEPHNALALYHLGYAYGQMDDHKQEVYYYEKAVSEGYDQNADLFFNLGMACGELNMTRKAISAFRKAIALNPKSAENYYGLALAHEADADFKSAETAFLKAIEIDPNHLDARLHLASLYVDGGNFAKARDQIRKILEIDPAHETARQLLNTIEKL